MKIHIEYIYNLETEQTYIMSLIWSSSTDWRPRHKHRIIYSESIENDMLECTVTLFIHRWEPSGDECTEWKRRVGRGSFSSAVNHSHIEEHFYWLECQLKQLRSRASTKVEKEAPDASPAIWTTHTHWFTVLFS